LQTILWAVGTALRRLLPAIVIGGLALLTACGDSVDHAVEDLIATELAQDYGLTATESNCEHPAQSATNVTFTCTSETQLGVVAWNATVADLEQATITLDPTNLIGREEVQDLEAEAASRLGAEVGLPLGPEQFDCGDGPRVLGVDGTIDCIVTEPGSGQTYDTTIEIEDRISGRFSVRVAQTPRQPGGNSAGLTN